MDVKYLDNTPPNDRLSSSKATDALDAALVNNINDSLTLSEKDNDFKLNDPFDNQQFKFNEIKMKSSLIENQNACTLEEKDRYSDEREHGLEEGKFPPETFLDSFEGDKNLSFQRKSGGVITEIFGFFDKSF